MDVEIAVSKKCVEYSTSYSAVHMHKIGSDCQLCASVAVHASALFVALSAYGEV